MVCEGGLFFFFLVSFFFGLCIPLFCCSSTCSGRLICSYLCVKRGYELFRMMQMRAVQTWRYDEGLGLVGGGARRRHGPGCGWAVCFKMGILCMTVVS